MLNLTSASRSTVPARSTTTRPRPPPSVTKVPSSRPPSRNGIRAPSAPPRDQPSCIPAHFTCTRPIPPCVQTGRLTSHTYRSAEPAYLPPEYVSPYHAGRFQPRRIAHVPQPQSALPIQGSQSPPTARTPHPIAHTTCRVPTRIRAVPFRSFRTPSQSARAFGPSCVQCLLRSHFPVKKFHQGPDGRRSIMSRRIGASASASSPISATRPCTLAAHLIHARHVRAPMYRRLSDPVPSRRTKTDATGISWSFSELPRMSSGQSHRLVSLLLLVHDRSEASVSTAAQMFRNVSEERKVRFRVCG